MTGKPRNLVSRRDDEIIRYESRELSEIDRGRLRGRKTAPKKWANQDRTIQTAEYKFWYEANRFNSTPEDGAEAFLFSVGDGMANHSVYYPEEYDKDIGDGAWIFVIDPPVTVQWSEFKVPLLSIWWAKPHVLNSGAVAGRLPYQAVIMTPAGDLHLWPHEYTICENPEDILGEDGTEIHSLGGDPLLDEDMLFYLQSRGISRQEATVMMFRQIRQQNFCYVTLPEYAVTMFAGVGTRSMASVREDYTEGKIA